MQEKKFKSLDLQQFKKVVENESARLRLRSISTDGESSVTLTLALSSAIKKIFFDKSEMTFSSEPSLRKGLVTQFANRMRVDAMEKFNATTVFAVLHFAANQEQLHESQKYFQPCNQLKCYKNSKLQYDHKYCYYRHEGYKPKHPKHLPSFPFP